MLSNSERKQIKEKMVINEDVFNLELEPEITKDILGEGQLIQIRKQLQGYKYLSRKGKIPQKIEEELAGGWREAEYIEQLQRRAEEEYKKWREVVQQVEAEGMEEQGEQMEQEDQMTLMFREVWGQWLKYNRQLEEGGEGEEGGEHLMRHMLLRREDWLVDKRRVQEEWGEVEEEVEQQRRERKEEERVSEREQVWWKFKQQLAIHQEQFTDYHYQTRRAGTRIAKEIKNRKETMLRRDQELREREEKERVKALKAQDFDCYLQLIQATKNERILSILHQTDNYLKQIGAKVISQKGGYLQHQQAEEQQKENTPIQQLRDSSKNYYELSHSIQEQIKEQPQLLKGKLKSYQLKGLEWLVSLYNNKINGILADEMGLGKTIQTIGLICYLIEEKKNFGPFMIVVPLTTLQNWVVEFNRWASAVTKVVYKGSKDQRRQLQHQMKANGFNVLISTYEYVIKDRGVLNKYQWKYMVIDEGHRIKNSRSKFSQILQQNYCSQQKLLLTGTPLQNNLSELWSLLNFLLSQVFNNQQDFQKWFNIYKQDDLQLNEEEQLLLINRLHQVLRPFLLRRVKSEVEKELPQKLEFILKVPLTAWQKVVYRQLQNKESVSISSKKSLQNLMIQLRKVCNHPYLFIDYVSRTGGIDELVKASGKFELLDRMMRKLMLTNHRVLIFSQMTKTMDILEIYLKGKELKYLRLDGSTKAEDRFESMRLFNHSGSEYSVFLLSTRAGGLGLNLQSADSVIIFDSDWNPQMDLQAQDRAHRIGQKSQVRVYRLITVDSIEEQILFTTNEKLNLDQIIIQAGLFNQISTDQERGEKIKKQLNKGNEREKEKEIQNHKPIYNTRNARHNQCIETRTSRIKKNLKIENKKDKREMGSGHEEEEEEDNDGWMNDDALNQILYRDQQELEMLQNYDKVNGQSTRQSRLITYNQIPKFVFTQAKSKEKNLNYGRGHRQKKQVNYNEELLSFSSFQSSDQSNSEEEEEEEEDSLRRLTPPQEQFKSQSSIDSRLDNNNYYQYLKKKVKKNNKIPNQQIIQQEDLYQN